MTDKEKIRKEVERLQSELIEENKKGFGSDVDDACILELQNVLTYIDSLQEEPVKIKKGCKYRSICNVTNNDTGNISFVAGKIYLAPEDDTLVSEENGWRCDTSENASNFELVDEPVSEDLEEAASKYAKEEYNRKNPAILPNRCKGCYAPLMYAFKTGAQWQKERFVAWLTRESDFLIQELKNGNKAYGLPEKYRVQLYKELIAKIKEE